jgi:hypothetical protein
MNKTSLKSIPNPKETNPVERWRSLVHSQTFRQLPLETSLSFPIPVIEGKTVQMSAFYYGVLRPTGMGSSIAMPPKVRLVATYPEGRILRLEQDTTRNLFPGIQDIPVPERTKGDAVVPGERARNRKALFDAYPDILELFRNGNNDMIKRADFRRLFALVVSVQLMPYYRALNPIFFSWLEQ